jgi:hypothetical protein
MLVVAAIAAAPASARSLPGNHFDITVTNYFLDATPASWGNIAGGSLTLEQPGDGMESFLAPGVDVLGVVNTPAKKTWLSTSPMTKDLEFVGPASARLYFSANAQGMAIFEARLIETDADGLDRLLSMDEQQFVTVLDPAPIDFTFDTDGQSVSRGSIIRLELYAETTSGLVILNYGGDTPSGLVAVGTRWQDSDGDGFADSDETLFFSNPLDPTSFPNAPGIDSDKDGLSDAFETVIGTDPTKADTDGDGFVDGLEMHAGSNPKDANSKPYDANGNGLPDVFENHYFNSTYGGITYVIGGNGTGRFDDPDHDGCDNACEAEQGTDPLDPDTDDDGILDGQEATDGTNPLSPGNVNILGPRGIPEPVAAGAAFAVGSTLSLVGLMRRPF